MKKALLILSLILSFTFSKAQQAFLFKIKYLPGQVYQSDVTTNTNMEMNISGDSATMEKIKAKGIKLPMLIKTSTDMDVIIKTGAPKADNTFPIAINYNNIISKKVMNGVESTDGASPLIGQTIFGQYTTDGKIQIDSISGKTLNDEIKTVLTKTISNLINQLQFPDHALKIGETFTQDVPFSLPIAGLNMALTIKIIYKLKSVEKNMAYFDLDESMDMDMSMKKDNNNVTMKGTGIGTGTMAYDIDKNLASSRSTNFKMNFQMLMGKLSMSGNAVMESVIQTKIAATNK
jgi:hypothetical protein